MNHERLGEIKAAFERDGYYMSWVDAEELITALESAWMLYDNESHLCKLSSEERTTQRARIQELTDANQLLLRTNAGLQMSYDASNRKIASLKEEIVHLHKAVEFIKSTDNTTT